MSKKVITLRFDDAILNQLKDIQDVIQETTGDKLGYSKILTLYVDMVAGNIDMNTILLHYSIVKDTILADGRTTRHKKV